MHDNNQLPDSILAGLEPLSRRRFLVMGVRATAASAALLTLPSQVIAASSVPPGITNLSDLEYRVFNKLRAVMLPTQKYGLPSTDEVPVMQNLDEWIGKLNQRSRLLVKVGVQTLEYGPVWSFSRFSRMSDARATKHAHSWQTGNVLQRGVMSSLKMLITLSYWQDIRTWPSLQYDGPVTEKWGIRRLGNASMPR